MTEGSRANRSGTRLEMWVRDILEENGYTRKPSSDFKSGNPFDQPCYAEQCAIGESIYGTVRSADFVLFHPSRWPETLVIQCKWQASLGSVDEKYPYEVARINYLTFPTIIVLDGGGYKTGAKDWLQQQAGSGNLLRALDMGEFARFCNQGGI